MTRLAGGHWVSAHLAPPLVLIQTRWVTSVALEKALDIEVSEQTVLLRKLMMMGQIINSHALHLFFFSLSDFFGTTNDLDLIKKFPDRAKDTLALREFGNKIIEIIGGRSIHPLTPTIGGFLKLPDVKKLGKIFYECEEVLDATKKLAALFIKLKYPKFIRSAPYASLHHAKEYAIYDGLIKTPDEKNTNPTEFIDVIKEFQLKDSAVKRARYHGKPFMVGAISRLNNNSGQLNPEAKKSLKAAKIHLPSFNPFHNILAQAIEMVHCVKETQKILRQILRLDLSKNDIGKQRQLVESGLRRVKKTVSGAAAIEAPRGTLYYFYEIGPDGLIKNCDIITPTSQNIARLEKDLEEYLPDLIGTKNTCGKNCENKITIGF